MEIQTELNSDTPSPRTGLVTTSGLLLGIGIGVVLSIVCLAIVVAGAFISSANPLADCKTRSSSLSDALRVQTFASGVFERPTWTESFSSSPDRVTKTWLSNELNAVSYLEYLMYNCGLEEGDIDTYYSDENFKKAIFQNYQDVEKTAECNRDQLRHFEFTSSYNSSKYVMYYWTQPDGNTRLLGFMMAFPITDVAQLQQYASRIYPNLASCD